jgi:hypothetical protein
MIAMLNKQRFENLKKKKLGLEERNSTVLKLEWSDLGYK